MPKRQRLDEMEIAFAKALGGCCENADFGDIASTLLAQLVLTVEKQAEARPVLALAAGVFVLGTLRDECRTVQSEGGGVYFGMVAQACDDAVLSLREQAGVGNTSQRWW